MMKEERNKVSDCKEWTPIEKELMFKCIWCDAEFPEGEIILDDEGYERCPGCNRKGHIEIKEDAIADSK